MSPKSATVLYIPHGGGPLPVLDDPGHMKLAEFLSRVSSGIKKPDAIVVISAHWEERLPAVISRPDPGLLYDYYGFPEEAYDIRYPVAGQPELGEEIYTLLTQGGLKAGKDNERGFDHGVFIPLKLMYPDASIPCVQLSLISGLDPEAHIRMGQALSGLLEKNILIIGSGFSFHNLGAFFHVSNEGPDVQNMAFHEWLKQALVEEELTAVQREQRLINWNEAPYARYNHPREEHLLPLHVCYGIANAPAKVIFEDNVIGKRALALQW